MSTKTTNPTNPSFKSVSSGQEMPAYKHSDASEFIRIENFDLFEYMLWHQNVARESGNAKAETLRKNGVLTLVGTPHADAAASCRGYFERFQEAFDAYLALKEEEKLARQNRGNAKGRLIPGWQEILSSSGKRRNDDTFVETMRSSLERLHSYKVASTACDVIQMTMAPAWQRLNIAQKELASRLSLLNKTTVKEMAMHNILCARQLLLRREPASPDVNELPDSSNLSCATQFFISDQWAVDQLGDKLKTGVSETEERPVGWGNMPSPLDY